MTSEILTTSTTPLVKYEMLNSLFGAQDVGYIRLSRFSRAATDQFLRAVDQLDHAGAQSYIIDLRNNYGGVIQEAMLLASSLLRDPHVVLCYTMNSRGGFTPHNVEEYVVDTRYPGYLLSRESRDVTRTLVRNENPQYFTEDGWPPLSSFASLREQKVTRGLTRSDSPVEAQKNVIVLINEGTASSAEVFASALHDNGRLVALVGTKSFGKGLVQHTFALPDGGGLRLTVAEYLTPALQHVTKVGDAQWDGNTGEWVRGGIRPDIYCDSRHGIPSNVGADLCVGIALDTMKEAIDPLSLTGGDIAVRRMGGADDGSRERRVVSVGIMKVRLD